MTLPLVEEFADLEHPDIFRQEMGFDPLFQWEVLAVQVNDDVELMFVLDGEVLIAWEFNISERVVITNRIKRNIRQSKRLINRRKWELALIVVRELD